MNRKPPKFKLGDIVHLTDQHGVILKETPEIVAVGWSSRLNGYVYSLKYPSDKSPHDWDHASEEGLIKADKPFVYPNEESPGRFRNLDAEWL